MIGKFSLIVVLAAAAYSLPSLAVVGPRSAETAIVFANSGGIVDWYANDETKLYVMDRTGRWYQARFQAPCWKLDVGNSLLFDTGISGRFDSFSSVVTPYGACRVDSLTRSQRPAAKGLKGIASATD